VIPASSDVVAPFMGAGRGRTRKGCDYIQSVPLGIPASDRRRFGQRIAFAAGASPLGYHTANRAGGIRTHISLLPCTPSLAVDRLQVSREQNWPDEGGSELPRRAVRQATMDSQPAVGPFSRCLTRGGARVPANRASPGVGGDRIERWTPHRQSGGELATDRRGWDRGPLSRQVLYQLSYPSAFADGVGFEPTTASLAMYSDPAVDRL